MKKRTKYTKHAKYAKHTKDEMVETFASTAISITIVATLWCAIFINPACLFVGLFIWLFISETFFPDDKTYPSEFSM